MDFERVDVSDATCYTAVFRKNRCYAAEDTVLKNSTSAKEAQRKPVSGREIVYQYIQKQMKRGEIPPGSVLDLRAISQALGISSTPLRDSLIRLEAEGYVSVFPRSKVVVNRLELEDFPFLYEIMGALEYTLIAGAMDAYTPELLAEMRAMNTQMREALLAGDMTSYDERHYAFHETFFQVRPNLFAKRILKPIKNRLWDFPRKNFVREWYVAATEEHEMIVAAIEARDAEALAHAVKERHWDFAYNQDSICKAYAFEQA